MIPFLPGRRRPDDPASRAHARAIELAAERQSEALPPEEDAWLEGHLAECEACAAIAADYEADARLLRSMPWPEAPRDLWARTSAAIQAEKPPRRASQPASRSLLPPLVPLGVLSGALVVGVVVLASFLSSPNLTPVTPSSQPIPSVAIASTSPVGTPIAVTAGEVGWVTQRQDGGYNVAYAPVQHVCNATEQADCAPLAPSSPVALTLQATPGAIVAAPRANQLVVVDSKTQTTGGALYVVDLPPASSPSPSPGASGSASSSSPTPLPPSASPPVSPSVSGSPATSATAPSSQSAAPSIGASPSATPPSLAIIRNVVVVGETGAYSPDGRWFAFSARPADGSRGPDIWVWSPGDAAAHAVTSDHVSVFAGWSGEDIIGSRAVRLSDTPEAGASPSASSDVAPAGSSGTAPAGSTASPSPSSVAQAPSLVPSASAGPSDSPVPSPILATPVSFVLDPATLASSDIPGDAMWRPVVDPSGTYASYWDGTLRLAPDGVDWLPDAGQLVLARWSGAGIQPAAEQTALPSASAEPGATGSASPAAGSTSQPLSPSPASPATPSPEGGSAASSAAVSTPSSPASAAGSPAASASAAPSVSPWPASLPAPLSGNGIRDWDIRWDPTGTRLAVWLADPVDATIGSLSLHTLDRASDTLDPQGVLLDQQTALPGFSIGAGRLAWATPPGQGGQESQVEVLAWTGAAAGRIQSDPGQGPGPLVVIR